jgi:hypothetical protein
MSSQQPPPRPGRAATAEELAARRSSMLDTGGFPAAGAVPSSVSVVQTQTTGTQWPQYVNRHRLVGALVAGFAATHAADMIGYWVRMFGFDIPPLDFAAFNGLVTGMAMEGAPQWWAGYLFHTMNGMVFALGYALLIFPLLGKTLTTGLNLARSLPMGLILATLSLAWWMPGNLPQAGIEPGTFSQNFGAETIAAVYFWHVVWALALGFFFNPQD